MVLDYLGSMLSASISNLIKRLQVYLAQPENIQESKQMISFKVHRHAAAVIDEVILALPFFLILGP